jgi:hypothetical protein
VSTPTTDTAADPGPDRYCGVTREEYINQVIAKAPPLTAEQLAKLSTLFDYQDTPALN